MDNALVSLLAKIIIQLNVCPKPCNLLFWMTVLNVGIQMFFVCFFFYHRVCVCAWASVCVCTWAGYCCWPAACLSERNSGSASCSDLVTDGRSLMTSPPAARWWCVEAECASLAERWWHRWNSRWDAVRRRETELTLVCYRTDRSQTETALWCNPTHTHTRQTQSLNARSHGGCWDWHCTCLGRRTTRMILKCMGWFFHMQLRTYSPGLELESRSRNSPSLENSFSAAYTHTRLLNKYMHWYQHIVRFGWTACQ